MGLKDIGETLPPGFRFYPSDEELVCHYLFKKITNESLLKGTLVEIDLHICEPWQLPDVAKLNANEWYFFSFRDRKYATGFRTNRATTIGYWKATGKDRLVLEPRTKKVVGMRKTLVFYRNRAPNGIKTGWIMHEFRLETPHMPPKEDWVLCRVFHKGKGGETSNSSSHNNNTHLHHQQHHHLFMEVTSTKATSGESSPSPLPPPPSLLVPSPTHQYHSYHNNTMIAGGGGGGTSYHDKSATSFSSNPIRLEMLQPMHHHNPTINTPAPPPLKLGILNDGNGGVQPFNGENNYDSSPISSMMQLINGGGKNQTDQMEHHYIHHQQYGSTSSLWEMNLVEDEEDNNNGGLGGSGFQHQHHHNNNPYHNLHQELIGDVSFEDHDGIVLL